ncbi:MULTISPECIES: chemotaxis protein CheW [unclassified Iodidimonas]|jgi:two-component system chemotaxis sensor kinase CheA|uniref:chemotaxis protein CheW n=1 Tax=unclassified Iodidimonas TaxID=2626145 RepID=UPI002483094F|nr:MULTISPECIES: chemotaxis protein CheW [unclassified Iodidimonas]
MDDLLNEFLTETAESIDVVDVELVKLEQDPNNKGVLDNIFRLVHTIKGTCGFLGLPRLESVAHASENVLGKFRDGELLVTPEAVTVVLESLDRIKEILSGLEQTETEPEGDDGPLIGRLDAIAEGKGAAAKPPSQPATAPEIVASTEPDASLADAGLDPDAGLGRPLKPGEVALDELERAFMEAPGPDDEPDQPSAPQATPKPMAGARLFERAGGEDAIAVMAHLLANRLPRHAKIGSFFSVIPDDLRKAKFLGLLTALFKEDESSSNNVMASIIGQPGFGNDQFDVLAAEMKAVFKEVKLAADVCDDAVMSLELVRDAALAASEKHVTKVKASAGAANDDHDHGGGGSVEKRTSQSIRVSVDLLEDLMNMVSELVLTRNQLLQMVREKEDSEFNVPIQRLSQTTTELQEGVMKTRMQPIGNAWAKLPRIVRDLSMDLDKKIELDMRGSETELDRQVLELIKDPLTHMVRNSADHGIETPPERVAMGKTEHGTIVLNAYHEGGHIIIEIRDDGRGIAADKIRKKALEKGLASEAELANMSEAQIQKFVFHAGFSTAAAVTSVSGRGVGMDVVRTNIEKIGGTIDMKSVEGKGTTFQIKIPLTLAIVSALIVSAAGERFAVPQISVLELVRAADGSDHRIERIKNTPVLRLRNRLLPLVYLNDILGFKKSADGASDQKAQDADKKVADKDAPSDDFIIVSQVGAFTFGIVVDQVYDTEEIVVKPVAPILKDLSIYSGNTILGDGSVIMILDPNGIAERTNSGVVQESGAVDEKAAANQLTIKDESESLLLFGAGAKSRKAVPLPLVARLEDIEVDKIELSDGRHVVQYRGALMPIVLADGLSGLKTEGRQAVLVFTDGDYTMGLAVDEILDIVEDHADIKIVSGKPGMVGSAIIGGKATEVIDVAYYLSQAFDDWLKSRDQNSGVAPERGTRILLIDDSAFFRNMLKPLLKVAGYDLTCVDHAQAAIDLRDKGEHFNLIISDIDMPGMDGFELAGILKKDGHWAHTPMVALSSFSSPKHLERGRAVGFDDYIAKFDRKALLECLSQQLKLQGDAA